MSAIEITISNEAELIEAYRKEIRTEARRAIYDSPERVGKRYASIYLPVKIMLVPEIDMNYKIEWV